MIHKVEDHYVISSRQVWLPGAYDTERAAKYAFRFPDEILRALQDRKNSSGSGAITFEDLQEVARAIK